MCGGVPNRQEVNGGGGGIEEKVGKNVIRLTVSGEREEWPKIPETDIPGDGGSPGVG